MEFTLNDDFSGVLGVDYIKQLELPYTPQAETTAYLNALSVTTPLLNYSKKKSIDNFFVSVKGNSGLWSKLTTGGAVSAVILPFWGVNSVSEGGINMFNPSFNVNLPTDSAIATYDTKGVRFLVGWSSPVTLNRRINTLAFGNTEISDNIGTQVSMTLGTYVFGRNAQAGETAYVINASVRPRVLSHSSFIGAVVATTNTTEGFTSINADGVDSTAVAVTNTDIASATPFAVILGGQTAGSATNRSKSAHGLFGWSTASLSISEKQAFQAALDTLLKALNQ